MPNLSLEAQTAGYVAGIDEVGRGPLAGPVVTAAVVLDLSRLPEALLTRIDDSKALSAKLRRELAPQLERCAWIGMGRAEVEEIDRINILQATLAAMRRAHDALVNVLPGPLALALVDGNRAPALPCPVRTVVGGDAISLSIAAASIIAKVARDAEMESLARDYPGYGWDRNAGYGTKQHLAALQQLGTTPHHRRSFAPVAACG